MKKKVALIFGGNSSEHDVSLLSATNIFNYAGRERFDWILLGVDRQGQWKFDPAYGSEAIDLKAKDYFADARSVYLAPGQDSACICFKDGGTPVAFDIAFPIVHGHFGEDGKLQGMLESMDIPYVGPGVLSSAMCMDKDVTKRLLKASGIPVAASFTLHYGALQQPAFDTIVAQLQLPLFVKPANAGSSVGVSKVNHAGEYEAALSLAFSFDNKVLVEEAVTGKEVECAVLGNEEPQASVLGEIVPEEGFYSYENKYLKADGASMRIPAGVDEATTAHIRNAAVAAYRLMGCEGLSRIDFFVRADNTYVLNEINTLPGFTAISMYAKLWAATGVSYPELVTRLIDLALARKERDARFRDAVMPGALS